MKFTSTHRMAVAASAIIVLALTGCTSSGSEGASGSGESDTGTVRIGINESLSGNLVAYGISASAAIRMAAEEINDAGGIQVDGVSYSIELVERDNLSTPTGAVAAQTELVEDEGIKFIFGPTIGALSLQSVEIGKGQDVIQLSPSGAWQVSGYVSNPDYPYVFSTQVAQDELAVVRVDLIEQIGADVVGLLGSDDDTTAGTVPPIQAELEKRGIEVVDVRFPTDASDLSPYLTRLKSEGADVVFYVYPQARGAEAARITADLGAAKGFVTTNTPASVALEEAVGGPLPIPWASAYGTPSFEYPANERIEAFTEKILAFEPKLPLDVASAVFWFYDYVAMLAEAMEQAGSVEDVPAIAEALQSITYDGVAGRICYRENERIPSADIGSVFVVDGEVESKNTPSSCD